MKHYIEFTKEELTLMKAALEVYYFKLESAKSSETKELLKKVEELKELIKAVS